MATERATQVEDYVRRLVDAAPPLSAEQRARLALLLCPVTGHEAGGRRPAGSRAPRKVTP